MTAAEWLDQAQAVWDAPLTDQERAAIAAAAMPRALAALRAVLAECDYRDRQVRDVWPPDFIGQPMVGTNDIRRTIEEALA